METAGLWNDAAFLRGRYGHSSTAFCWLQVAAEQAGVVFLLHGGVFVPLNSSARLSQASGLTVAASCDSGINFMFADRAVLYCRAGDGGNGCSSFRLETFVPRGGPDGGDGGNGGDVMIEADRNVGSLSNLVGHRHWKAQRGEHGQGALCTGKCGEPTVIRVPPGTVVRDLEHGHVLRDLQEHGDTVTVAKGGRGGKGNKRFATAVNRAPRECEGGFPGEYREVELELKIIADVGLIGKPNAGKSTLLSRVSRATPEIANYPFTTRYPNLGVVQLGYDHDYVLADIPGLIEGAHAGTGLGHEFLRHVERTRLLVHLVEPCPIDQTDPLENYQAIRDELRLYDPQLAERPELICVTKAELPDAAACAELLAEETGQSVNLISAVTGQGLPELNRMIVAALSELSPESPVPSPLPDPVSDADLTGHSAATESEGESPELPGEARRKT
ncbi:MAG: GTPase ObgE [Planctomycetaceae bacterium]